MSGEVNMTNSPGWYDAVAVEIGKRDRALKGIARWQKALDEAEAEIADLKAQGEEPVTLTGPEQVQE